MSFDPDIAQAYREVAAARRWKRERESPRWKLAAAAATNHNLLVGPSLLKHATSPDFSGNPPKETGKRKLVKAI